MSVVMQLQGDRLLASLSGEIDHHHAERLRELIDSEAARVRPQELVLDFSQVTFMDSSGIGLILGRYRWIQELGGMVRITHISPQMEQILVLSGIHQLVQVECEKEEKKSENGIKTACAAHTACREIYSDSSKEVRYDAK